MITMSQLYWLTRLDSIGGFFCIISIISGIVSLALGCIILASMDSINEKEDEQIFNKIIKYFKTAVFILFASILTQVFIPTTKEVACIYVLPKIVNSDFVQKELPKEGREIYSMAKDYLKSKLTDNKEDANKK